MTISLAQTLLKLPGLSKSVQYGVSLASTAFDLQNLTNDQCAGPTCDSIDVVQPRASLPVGALAVGDWLRWENMGAYTICAASQFNGFRKSLVRYTIDAGPGAEGARVDETIRRLVAGIPASG